MATQVKNTGGGLLFTALLIKCFPAAIQGRKSLAAAGPPKDQRLTLNRNSFFPAAIPVGEILACAFITLKEAADLKAAPRTSCRMNPCSLIPLLAGAFPVGLLSYHQHQAHSWGRF